MSGAKHSAKTWDISTNKDQLMPCVDSHRRLRQTFTTLCDIIIDAWIEC